MTEYLPWFFACVVVLAATVGVWWSLRRPQPAVGGDEAYQQALEAWVQGEADEAIRLLRMVVQDNPEHIEPFLHLGTLMREQGDASRAAVLHRSLTVRPGLNQARKIAIGLALAEDLLALEKWADAGAVLDTIMRPAQNRARYWRARFRQFHGAGNLPDAARALKKAPRFVAEKDKGWFQNAYVSYQLDRALEHVRLGELSAARPRLRDVERMPQAHPRATLVRAMLAARDEDPTEALTLTAEGLLDSPEELAVFLPTLQEVLLHSGQYARTVPILERACQAENAPPSLWVNLALLYEKLGQRDKALRFLESKTGRGNFTPNQAAPFLRLLAQDAPPGDFLDVWHLLDMPAPARGWTCRRCGRLENGIRWFCPACGAFDSFQQNFTRQEGSL